MNLQENTNGKKHLPDTIDALIVGAGFAGLFMLHELRTRGYSTKVFEAGDEIGGTWYWNRYPGARCDVESAHYSYSFSHELQQQWHWSERFATQQEILRYLNHVADRLDLRKDIQLGTRVTSILYDEDLSQWTITTNHGDHIVARFCIMATGCLSIPKDPDIKGLDQFKGNIYSTSKWPKEDVNFIDRRVAVIGTGSSGIQCIPIIAKQAAHLYVFQRTPNFVLPLEDDSVNIEHDEEDSKSKDNQSPHQILKSDEERYDAAWRKGVLAFLTLFKGKVNDKATNEVISNFIRAKIRETVKDPVVAEALLPYDHYFGVKRPCVGLHYYETYNRDNVKLVDIRNKNIDEITLTGIQIGDNHYEVDDIILALGFDAITGAMQHIDIRGRSGKILREKWSIKPRTLLGIMIAGFPNLFTITGPGSPVDLGNMIPHIEQNVKWITKCMEHLKKHHIDSIEPTINAQNDWMDHVDMVASQTLYVTSNTWYNGSNIPGKPRVFMPYAGGFLNYLMMCKRVEMNDYKNFFLLKQLSPSSL